MDSLRHDVNKQDLRKNCIMWYRDQLQNNNVWFFALSGIKIPN